MLRNQITPAPVVIGDQRKMAAIGKRNNIAIDRNDGHTRAAQFINDNLIVMRGLLRKLSRIIENPLNALLNQYAGGTEHRHETIALDFANELQAQVIGML